MRPPVMLAALALACAGAPPISPPPAGLDDGAARVALARFARALEASRFEEAHLLLSARWRTAYTPGRLALDFRGAGPAAREAAGRVLAALAAGAAVELRADRARLPLDGGRAAAVVAEGGGWRVDALE